MCVLRGNINADIVPGQTGSAADFSAGWDIRVRLLLILIWKWILFFII